MLSFRQLQAHDITHRAWLWAVIKAAPTYSRLVKGRLPVTADADECLDNLPPGLTWEDKLVGGFWHGERMIGCLDLCRGYPRPHIAYFGLLVFAEVYQGCGFGRQALGHIHAMAAAWGCRELRLAVIETNSPALGFWRHQGFVERHRKRVSGYLGEVIVMQRPVSVPIHPCPGPEGDHQASKKGENG